MELTRPQAPGDRFVNEQNVGQLLVFEVLEPVYGVQTENGVADAIRANVYVITPQATVGASYMGTLVFGKVLFSRLVQSVGKAVVGVFTGQPGVKVAGKNVAYDLQDPDDAMMAAASRAMMSKPAPQQQPATGWGAQPGVPQPQSPWGQQPAGQQQGPPPGWGQQPAPTQSNPWGTAPAPDQQWGQQQLPAAPPAQPGPPPGWGQQPAAAPQPPVDENVPPWERQQQPAGQAPWGGQQ
jgi:hypothetical protein